MNFLIELWSVMVRKVLSWFESLNNETLTTVANLLTILVILIGLTDWTFRKIRHRKVPDKKLNALKIIENTQKPFKVVDMLNNPMYAGEKLGIIVEDTTKILGGKKMKKVFKWIWYNKEQLLSIAYQVVLLAVANILLFTDAFNTVITLYFGVPIPLWVKIIATVLALALTALSVRNVVVTYGLSSLETIDNVLKERAEAKAAKLSPEQQKIYKNYITTLNDTLHKAKKELQGVEDEFTKLRVLYEADNSLVADYTTKAASYQNKIASGKENITNLENRILHFKDLLSGNVVEQ